MKIIDPVLGWKLLQRLLHVAGTAHYVYIYVCKSVRMNVHMYTRKYVYT